jgi:hypothetical protein
MKLGRIARLYLPPTFVLSVLAVPRTPHLGSAIHVLAGWSRPPSAPEGEPPGAGADPDAGLDAGEDAGDAGDGGAPKELCGADNGTATTATLGAGCC